MCGSPFATGTSSRAGCGRTQQAISEGDGAALLDWFADGAMTLLGYHVETSVRGAYASTRDFQHSGSAYRRGWVSRRNALFRKGRPSAAHG